MAFKLIAVLACVAAASAGIVQVQQHHEVPQEHHYYQQPAVHVAASQPVLLHKQHLDHEEYPNDPHPQYNFSYDVQDAVSGDSKSQSESRDGDVVHGEYSLNDADGFRRTVKYTADSVNGFNAVVHREPLAHKVVAAAPVQYHHAAPTYANLPAHHDHQAQHTYAAYEAPQQAAHEVYQH